MPRATWKVGGLLFFSGMCSLIYETVWIRELRLVFGASTSASAAVVACFIGGLGIGGLLLGKRADQKAQPLGLYASLELVIALSAAVTPLLLRAVRATYLAVGGIRALGPTGGTLLRLVLSALVFAVPTLAMGGTLPAAARAVEEEDDRGRRSVAWLYGINTLGAVTGCLGATFLLLEVYGTRLTLWLACLVNVLVAMVARSVARGMPEKSRNPEVAAPSTGHAEPRPRTLVLFAAAVTGFVFCLMEIVWYRMLGPLLGGSVFTFGLILAVALAGIGLGGMLYAAVGKGRGTVFVFAWTCLLEALCVAAPYAYGDRLAVLAALLRRVGALGFPSQVAGWTVITSIVVFPAAVVTGAQFPLLIALLGRGDKNVGRDVGLAYAFNTAGAITGSLAGGFGLVPLLSAPGCWRLVGWVLLVLGTSALIVDLRGGARRLVTIVPVLVGALAALSLRAAGPSAAWRHSPIGAGRVDPGMLGTPNAIRAWVNKQRRSIDWEADGRESSVAIEKSTGLSFVVNGKNDGNARGDAATAVMLGLIGAILHPHPTRSMVIGLGTGSSAGWLGAVPTMTDIDVAELEPAIVEVARRAAPVNHGALDNSKVHLIFADAREALLASRAEYDLIASEPSNPYRAGVASLFTREYYEAAASRLRPGGIFVQWIQGYEVDGQTMRTVYATLATAFPFVETWEAETADVLLVASREPIDHRAARLRPRIAEEPFKTALALAWRVNDLEGMLGHFVAGPSIARAVAEEETEINTDDLNLVEFGFAQSLGKGGEGFNLLDVMALAREHGAFRPDGVGEVDWDAVEEAGMALGASDVGAVKNVGPPSPEMQHRENALNAALLINMRRAASEWRAQPREPRGSLETAFLGLALADSGDVAALPYIEQMRAYEPVEADVVLGRLLLRQGRTEEAWAAMERAYLRYRTDPWPLTSIMLGSLDVVEEVIVQEPKLAGRIWSTLREPFVMRLCDEARMGTVVSAASRMPPGEPCASAFEAYEPNPLWMEKALVLRAECYAATRAPLASRAEKDVLEFRLMRPSTFAPGP
jgi:spermidine synthase